MELQVMKGNKVVEAKDGRVNKGIAASHWLTKVFGFILAVGDDLTDEDMFKVLLEDAYSVKIGFTPSKARFYLGSPKEVRALLEEMKMVEVYK
ncbi:MAG: trehalose-phosphatase [Candidatus Methanospirareceae archaeon]